MAAAEDLTCRALVELVTEHLEGTLDDVTDRRLRAHLRECPACAAYVEQMKLTIALMGRVDPDALSPAARHSLQQAFRDWAARG